MRDAERELVKRANGLFLDFFDAFLAPLEAELGQKSSHALGRAHGMIDLAGYMTRIDATNFALANDDGGQNRDYDRADVMLIGVSRSGKTPTCLYMALQYGVFAANYPLTEEDLESGQLPAVPFAHTRKLFGLTIDAVAAAADPRGAPARQPLRLGAAGAVRGARAERCSALWRAAHRYDGVLDRGDREPHPAADRNPAPPAAVIATPLPPGGSPPCCLPTFIGDRH